MTQKKYTISCIKSVDGLRNITTFVGDAFFSVTLSIAESSKSPIAGRDH